MADYKARKEAFVSNLTGSSVWEVNAVTLVAPAAVLLWSVLQARQRIFTPYTAASCLVDLSLNCGAILLATTLYSSAPLLLNGLLLVPAIVSLLTPPEAPKRHNVRPPKENGDARETRQNRPNRQLPVKAYITHYRGTMMVITCVAILAVDFHVFPRRFAKVETWGTSLMDMGVGSFVFSGGFVNARTDLKEQANDRHPSLFQRLSTSMRHSLPLLFLGLTRLASVKASDYAEHVSEYGVHWNFFFTLGFLPPFAALFQSAFGLVRSYAVLALLLAVTYEVALDFTDLGAFALTAPRTDLISSNKEGICSFLGYLAIFLAGQATGMYCLHDHSNGSRGTTWRVRLKQSGLTQLASWSAIWTALYVTATNYYGLGLPVSRRLANLPYFLWVTAFNCGQLTLFCAIEVLCFSDSTREAREKTSDVLHAFNRNGLAMFLLANVATGLINLSLPTLDMERLEAMAVLITYVAGLSAVALALDRYNISIKI